MAQTRLKLEQSLTVRIAGLKNRLSVSADALAATQAQVRVLREAIVIARDRIEANADALERDWNGEGSLFALKVLNNALK